jgi:coenzyme F420-reducing hydrogenase delta subunit
VEVPLTAAWKDAPVLGCPPVDCHYLENNLRARSRAYAINLILKDFGLEPERSRLEWPRLPEDSAWPKG